MLKLQIFSEFDLRSFENTHPETLLLLISKQPVRNVQTQNFLWPQAFSSNRLLFHSCSVNDTLTHTHTLTHTLTHTHTPFDKQQ